MREWAALTDGENGLAVALKGVYDYEANVEPLSNETNLAFTLIRGFELMGRINMPQRKRGASMAVPVPGAQCLGEQTIEWSFIPFAPEADNRLPFVPVADSFLYPPVSHAVRTIDQKPQPAQEKPLYAWDAQNIRFSIFKREADGDGYVLLYFLGDVTDDFMSRVNAFAREKGLKIVSAFIKNGTATRNDYDPADFVGLVRNAGYVFTDSFHGVAFSIIFNRTFWAFQRAQPGASMKSRIVSILDRLGLEDRLCAAFPEKAADIDYTAANDILESERAKFACFVNDIVQNGISD